jgi:hypothetical protein
MIAHERNAPLKSLCLFLETAQRDRLSRLSVCLSVCLSDYGVRLHVCQAPFKDNLVCVSLLIITEKSAERKGVFFKIGINFMRKSKKERHPAEAERRTLILSSKHIAVRNA